MLADEIEKSLDLIVFNWMAKNFYSDMTEGQIRKSLHNYLNPLFQEIRTLENDISDSYNFGMGDTDELLIELSRKKMSYIKKVSELMRIN
jgi:hypothetical protein